MTVDVQHDINDHALGLKHNLESIDIFNDNGTISEASASRRSLDRVSVPVWGTFLSEPLNYHNLGRAKAEGLGWDQALFQAPEAARILQIRDALEGCAKAILIS